MEAATKKKSAAKKEPQGKTRSTGERRLKNLEDRFLALDMERLKKLSYDSKVKNTATDFYTSTKKTFSLIMSALPRLYPRDFNQLETHANEMVSGFRGKAGGKYFKLINWFLVSSQSQLSFQPLRIISCQRFS